MENFNVRGHDATLVKDFKYVIYLELGIASF